MNYNVLIKLRDKHKPYKEFAQRIGMTEHGVTRMLKHHTLTVETLERISLVFNVPIISFFDESDNHIVNDNTLKYGNQACRDCDKMRGKLELALKMLSEKDLEIARLNQLIGKKNNHVA